MRESKEADGHALATWEVWESTEADCPALGGSVCMARMAIATPDEAAMRRCAVLSMLP